MSVAGVRMDAVKELTPIELTEMIRSQGGVVTAVLADDNALVTAQIKNIVEDLTTMADGDGIAFVGLAAKQIEAAARFSAAIVKMLGTREQFSAEYTQRLLAEALAEFEMPNSADSGHAGS